MITQSMEDHLRAHLFGAPYNYPTNKVELIDGFDEEDFDKKFPNGLNKTFIAATFQFDDGGTPLELGGSLTQYLHTVDFHVVGQSAVWARNVAFLVKSIFLTDTGSIPLRDYNVASDPRPIIDYLPVVEASVEKDQTPDPRPWQRYAWVPRIRVTDETYAVL